MSDRRMEQAALDYAKRGYWIFPCRRDKAPYTGRGFKDATRDERKILGWWDRWPDASIGVDLKRSGAVILDIDSKHGADPEEVAAELELDGGLVRTETGEAPERSEKYPDSLAGLRGAQVWWRGNHPTTTTRLKGVQLRGPGTYAVVPPSLHPSGVAYLGELPPAGELPELPEAVQRVCKREPGEKAPPVEDAIEQGARHETLMSLAGTMRRRGMGEAEMLAALLITNEQRCRPPLPEAEVAHVAEVAAKCDSAEGPKRGARFLSDLHVDDILKKHPELDRDEVEDVESFADLEKLLRADKVPDVIVRLVLEAGTELFHDAEDVPYASFDVGGHTETWPVRSRSFKLHCRRLYYEEEEEAAPNGQALTDALGVLEAKALFEGDEHEVIAASPASTTSSTWTSATTPGRSWPSTVRAGGSSRSRRSGSRAHAGCCRCPIRGTGATSASCCCWPASRRGTGRWSPASASACCTRRGPTRCSRFTAKPARRSPPRAGW